MSGLDEWITTNAGAELTGYSQAYVRQLARSGRIPSRKAGRDWLVNRGELLTYKAQMDTLGSDKHNPWRDPDRGRRASQEV